MIDSNTPYLFIGDGRLARHLQHYFQNQTIPYLSWSRSTNRDLGLLLDQCKKVLLCISDDAIADFYQTNYSPNSSQIWIHFSGSLSITGVQSAHPLMAFGHDFLPLDLYPKIWFITEIGRLSFHDLFPELTNPNFSITPEQKPFYHTWASLAGNLTTKLWVDYRDRLANAMNLPAEAIHTYLTGITQNILNDSNPLTGPTVRGDMQTLNRHLKSLENDEYRQLYEAFINLVLKDSK